MNATKNAQPSRKIEGQPGQADPSHTGAPSGEGHETDASAPRWNDWLYDVVRSHNVRDLRHALMDLAWRLQASQNKQNNALCLLTDSRISDETLVAQFAQLRAVLRSTLRDRILLARFSDEHGLEPLPRDAGVSGPKLKPQFIQHLQWVSEARKQGQERGHGLIRLHLYGVLIQAWLEGGKDQAMTTQELQDAVGASYPTVAKELTEFEAKGHVVRHKDRRVALSMLPFPTTEWRWWVASSLASRKTVSFASSHLGRTAEDLASRLKRVDRDDVAIGGVLAAKQYWTDFDLSAAPRLDLVMASTKRAADLEWVKKLDAGLKRLDDNSKVKAQVVIHFVGTNQRATFMVNDHHRYADYTQCLLDLYALRLDTQADAFLRFLIAQRSSVRPSRKASSQRTKDAS